MDVGPMGTYNISEDEGDFYSWETLNTLEHRKLERLQTELMGMSQAQMARELPPPPYADLTASTPALVDGSAQLLSLFNRVQTSTLPHNPALGVQHHRSHMVGELTSDEVMRLRCAQRRQETPSESNAAAPQPSGPSWPLDWSAHRRLSDRARIVCQSNLDGMIVPAEQNERFPHVVRSSAGLSVHGAPHQLCLRCYDCPCACDSGQIYRAPVI